MIEKENRQDQITEIVYGIKDLNYKLGAFFDERRGVGRLDDETHGKKQSLQAEKNQRIIDLLLVNNGGKTVRVDLVAFQDEILHPFSMNNLGFEASYDNPYKHNPVYYFKARLSDLRRKDVCEDSLEVVSLLGEVGKQPEKPMDFFDRTIRELSRIKEVRAQASDLGSDFVVDVLDKYSADIVQKRLVDQRDILPRFSFDHTLKFSERKNREYESVRIMFGNRNFEFYWRGKRLTL